jgi:hypothetical protein
LEDDEPANLRQHLDRVRFWNQCCTGTDDDKSACDREDDEYHACRSGTTRRTSLVVLGLGLLLSPARLAGLRAAHYQGGSQLAASGGALQLRSPRPGSAWVGYNFSVGEKLKLDFTPMLGGVFGKTNGYAPGYEFTVSWRKLQVEDLRQHGASYFAKPLRQIDKILPVIRPNGPRNVSVREFG